MNRLWSAALATLLAAGAWGAPQKEKAGARPSPVPGQPATVPDRAQAYYHFTLAHLYEELAVAYNRQDYFNRAIEEYKQAIQYDPSSAFLNAELADLYARTGRIRDAVMEAEEVLKRDPANLDARRLLGRVYLRVLGDPPGGRLQSDVLHRAIEQYEKIVELDARDVEARVTLARLYRLNNDFTKAEAALKEALKLQPESEEALTSLALLYTDTSQLHAAVELLEKVTAKNSNPKLFAALGSAYEQARNHEKAAQAFRKALELDRDNLEYMRALGQNLLYNEQYEEALAQYKAIAAAQPQDGNAFLRMGQIYRQQRKYDLALENLKKAGSLMPDSLEVPYNLALLHETQGHTNEAIDLVKKLLERTAKANAAEYSPREKANRAIFYERLGLLYRGAENYEAAEEAFRQMMDADEENAVRGISQAIETLRQAKNLAKALAEAEAAVQKFPAERSLKLVRASLLGDNGRLEEAVRSLQALLQSKPQDREVLLTLAQVNERAKRWAEAEQAVAAAEKLSTRKDEKEFVYFLWGSILERQKKYEAAEEQFQKALAISASSPMTLNYLGYMLADRGVRLEEAKKYIEAALDQDPNNGAYLDSLGWVYFKLNRLEEAERYLLKALQRISRDGTIYDHLGDVYFRLGRIREAVAQWQRALSEWARALPGEVDPADVARVQKKLESGRVRLAQETGKKQ